MTRIPMTRRALVLLAAAGGAFSARKTAATAPARQAPVERETVVIDDRLQGKTRGTVVGGTLTDAGYLPGMGAGHVLYRLDRTVAVGYAEFEFRGMDPARIPADSDPAFFAMYDGRGFEEPIAYFDGFKSNHYRWNVHWRQNLGVLKAIVSCRDPAKAHPGGAQQARFVGERDWSVEPNGKPVAFAPGQWHRMRIEWGGRRFRVLVDGQEVWSAAGPFEYAPAEQRIWLGSAPGYVKEGKAKYTSVSDAMIYRNFRLVACSSTGTPEVASLVSPPPPGMPVEEHASQPAPPEAGSGVSAPPTAPLVSFAAPWSSPYRVDPLTRFHLINREGDHLFPLNKTAWAYFQCRDPEGVLARARAQGMNVLRVALEGRPHFDHLQMDMWPWGGTRAAPNFTRMNAAYWDEVERRVQLAGKAGIGLDVVLYFTLKPGASDPNEAARTHQLYWGEALRRLGRFANVLLWEIANEYTKNEAFQDLAGAYLKAHDPFGRSVCSSDGTTDDALWPYKPWMDLAINHSCTGSTPRYDLERWYLAVARNTRAHGKPAFCNESGREKRHGNDDGTHRRKQGWLWCAAGAYWTYHSWEGCEGIDDAGYRGPGQEFLLPMARFFSSLPFARMAPNQSALALPDDVVGATLALPDRDAVMAYLCTRETGLAERGAKALLRLPAGEYSVTLIRPSDGQVVEERTHRSSGAGDIAPLSLPDFVDDLAIVIRLNKAGERRPLPGTG